METRRELIKYIHFGFLPTTKYSRWPTLLWIALVPVGLPYFSTIYENTDQGIFHYTKGLKYKKIILKFRIKLNHPQKIAETVVISSPVSFPWITHVLAISLLTHNYTQEINKNAIKLWSVFSLLMSIQNMEIYRWP